MDDVTLGGSQETVAKDVQIVMDVGRDVGLNINVSKCEFIVHPGCHVTDPTLLSFQLLGAPLFPGTVLDLTWAKRCYEHKRFLCKAWV